MGCPYACAAPKCFAEGMRLQWTAVALCLLVCYSPLGNCKAAVGAVSRCGAKLLQG